MAHDPSAFIQEHFRIRLTDNEALDAAFDGGDPAEDTNATVGTGNVFRVRFKARETAGGSDNTDFKVQVNYEGNGFEDCETDIAGAGAATAVASVLSSQFADGASSATERLTNSGGAFVAGQGDEQNNVTSGYSLTSEETEIEFALRINSWYDVSGVETQTAEGDTFVLRVIESGGAIFAGSYTSPTITVAETDFYLGGTAVESPTKNLIAASNGDLYFLMEAFDVTGNGMFLMKSTDGGRTWREGASAASRPTTGDLEGCDMMINPADPDMLCIVVDDSGGQFYFEYLMSTDATNPDTWATKDEVITSVNSFTTNCISLWVRDEGGGSYTVVCAYTDDIATPPTSRYNIRSTGGTWGGSIILDATASISFISPVMVADSAGLIYLFYKQETATGEIFYKTLSTSDVLSGRTSVAGSIGTASNRDNMPYVEPRSYLDGSVEVVVLLYQTDTDTVITSRYLRDGSLQSPTTATDTTAVSSQGGSHQTVGTAMVWVKEVLLFYNHEPDEDMYLARNDDEGGWGTDVEQHDAIILNWVKGLVFTHASGNGGDTVAGYVYDKVDNSNQAGGHGTQWYDEVFLASAAAAALPAAPVILQAVNRAATY